MKEFTHRQLFLWQHVFFEHLTWVLVTTVVGDFSEDASSTDNKTYKLASIEHTLITTTTM